MRASVVLSLLIAVVTASLFGTAPAASGDQTPSGSRVGALDPSGATQLAATLWSKRYTRPGNDFATDLGVSPDGSKVFVTGRSDGPTSGYDYATVAYDASTGATLWSKRYTGPGDHSDYASALGVSPDGSKVYVTGSRAGSTGGFDYATVAYDASTGVKLWVKRYNGPGNGGDEARALGVSLDGSEVFVTGISGPLTVYDWDYATVAYDASTGAELWVKRYSVENEIAYATALVVSTDSSQVFVTGYTERRFRGSRYATVAYDASTGAEQWVMRYSGPSSGSERPTALGVSPDGSQVFVTGFSEGSTNPVDDDYATVAYDASTGAQLWARRYTRLGNDIARALGVSPDGSKVFVTGDSEGSATHFDYATVAYDAATGAKLWVRHYTRPGYEGALALGMSPDGSDVFVTGYTEGSTSGYDYATVGYDASTGAKLWVRRYTRLGSDDADALGVSPDGSEVFVTGDSEGSTSGFDYATVAYVTP